MAKRMCSIEGCGNPHSCRGWCEMHYQRWRKHGSTSLPTDMERFLAKVDVGHPLGCWLWTGGKTGAGYGQFGAGGQKFHVHRWLYQQMMGPIPDGLELDHLCRNPPCVNPDHLEPVTHAENIRRGVTAAVVRRRAAAKTHCKRGHEFVPDNTIRDPRDGSRSCRTCRGEMQRRRRAAAMSLTPT